MTLYALIFYVLAAVIVVATIVAVTRRNLVHAVVYLIISFFGTAMVYCLFGAPFLGILEVIIYAGAIMVLFLFIIMMLELAPGGKPLVVDRPRWLPVVFLSLVTLGCTVVLIVQDPAAAAQGAAYHATPRDFGTALFDRYALAVQVVSFQLLFAAVGAYYVGKGEPRRPGAASP